MTTTRRLAAILAADVAGYSAMMERDEEGTFARVRALRRDVIEPKLAEHQGRLIKTTGDGFLAEFASPIAALKSALSIQASQAEGEALQLRIGLNLGDVIIEDGDVYGEGVNVAARLEALAEPGGILVSDKIHREVEGKVAATFEDRGEQQVKNIAKPVRAYAVRTGVASSGRSSAVPEPGRALPLPDKPSIAVLPFQNMSGDPEQEYFADGMVEDITTALSRFKQLFVIARNSSFTYKGKVVDIKQVGRELGVRYVLEGSVRKAGNRVRVTAQLIDAATNDHLWAERYDREYSDVFTLQEEVTRSVVVSIAPQIDRAEIARSRRDTSDTGARALAWRANGLLADALRIGNAALMPEVMAACERAITVDDTSVAARLTLAMAHWCCHLWRWGDRPADALDRAWSVVEQMTAIDPQNAGMLTMRGLVHVARREFDRGLADLRRALEINPNSVNALLWLAVAEATVGLVDEAEEHAKLALRLSPRERNIGPAYLVLAMVHFSQHNYAEAARWCEQAIQLQPRAPIRRALMIACSARAGEMARARSEIGVLNSFAPDFIGSLFRGENPVFTRPQDMNHLLEGLRLAGLPE